MNPAARLLLLALAAAALLSAADDTVVFAFFRNNGEDGLYLAESRDGLKWTPLNGDRPLLAPTVGESKLMRDPSIARGPDGTFHMVWTTSWQGRTLGYSSSRDLIHWTPQRTIEPFPADVPVLNCWAPELFYDAASKEFLIIWASSIRGRFPETLGQGTRDYNHRLYAIRSSDMKSFTPAEVFYDPGFQVIDGAVFKTAAGYGLIAKNETQTPPAKYLFTATAAAARGPYSKPSDSLSGPEWAEGPSPLWISDNELIVYFDKYRDKRWGAIRTGRDLKQWEDVSNRLAMPAGARHGTALRVPRKIVDALKPRSDRAVAEWALRLGGFVVIDGQTQRIWDVAALPRDEFRLRTVNLVGVVLNLDELQNLNGLTHLKELYLSGRFWHNVPARECERSLRPLATLAGLERFAVSEPVQTDIPIEDDGLAHLAKLPNLRELRIDRLKIKGRTLAPLTGLRYLDVNMTRFDDEGMKTLAGMKHLERLLARDTLITDEGLKTLSGLTELRELDLHNTRISDAGLENLRPLTKLRKLNILGATVTDAGLDVLLGMPELEELNIYRTKVTNTGLAKLAALKKLRNIDVRYTAATGTGVESLKQALPGLRVAFLETGRGAGMGDAQLEQLAKQKDLKKLDLSATEVGDLGLRHLTKLTALEELNLAQTTVSDAGLAHLAALPVLRKLTLDGTMVRGSGLGAFTRLTDLSLANAPVGNDGLTEIAKLSNLNRLNLSYTEITDAALPALAGLKALTDLDLTGADISDKGIQALAAMPGLRRLGLAYGRFTDKGTAALASLTSLTHLDLTRTRAGDATAGALAALTKLESLKMDYTALTEKGLGSLRSLTSLRELTLDSATLTDAAADVLTGFPHLKLLNVYHTLLTDAGFAKIKAALPGCRIIYERDSALPLRRGS